MQSRRIPWKPRAEDSSVEGLIVEIVHGDAVLRLGCIYMPPPASVTTSFRSFVETLNGYPCLLCGDINLQHPTWWESAGPSDHADQFVAMLTDAGFTLDNVPNVPTYHQRGTWSALDVTWTRAISVDAWRTLATVDSDHRYILYSLNSVHGRYLTPSIPTFSRLFYSWKLANWGHFKSNVRTALTPLGEAGIDAYLASFNAALRSAIQKSCPRGCRTRGVSRWSPEMAQADQLARQAMLAYEAHPCPETLRTLHIRRHERDVVIKTALRDTWHKRISQADPGSPVPWSMLRTVHKAPVNPLVSLALSSPDGRSITSIRHKLRLLAKTLLFLSTRPTKPSHIHSSRPLSSLFQALICPHVTSVSLPPPPPSPLFIPDSPTYEPSDNSSFFSARSAPSTSEPPTPRTLYSFSLPTDSPDTHASSLPTPTFARNYNAIISWMEISRGEGIDSPFVAEEMTAALARLQDSRASGPDGIYNEMLHHLPSEARTHLLTLINWMWLTHHVPQEWRNAHVTPLPKPGKPPEQPSSYRPISLTSCVSKLMERMVLARLLRVWHPHPCQYAYRRGYTTEMEIAHITDLVEVTRDEYYSVMLPKRSGVGLQRHYRARRTLIILVDFSKAFDTVDHAILVRMLVKLPGNLLKRWLRNFLMHRFARVKLGNRFSEQYSLRSGVPQGTVLGPQLFSMYTTPLLEMLVRQYPDVQFDMYADDLTISIPCRTRDEGVGTGNAILADVAGWSSDHGMMVNPQKCEALLCTLSSHTGEDRVSRPLHLGEHEVQIALFGDELSPRLLGLQLDTRANFNNHASAIQKQARMREAQLSCLANHRYGPLPADMRQFVSGYGDSKLVYGSAVAWGTMQDTAKRKLICQYARLHRLVTGLPSTTDEESVLFESCALPLHIKVLRARLMLYESLKFDEQGWAARPPPQPPPLNFRSSPINRCEMDKFIGALLTEEGLSPNLRREAPLLSLLYSPWSCWAAERVTIGNDLPLDHSQIHTDEDLLRAKHIASMEALCALPRTSFVMATDGSSNVTEHSSAAAAILLSSPFSTRPLDTFTEDCGPLACSYRTESLALLRGLQHFFLPVCDDVPEYRRSLTVVTDSQSLLAALAMGPLRQRSRIESKIYALLLHLGKGVGQHICNLSTHMLVCLAMRLPILWQRRQLRIESIPPDMATGSGWLIFAPFWYEHSWQSGIANCERIRTATACAARGLQTCLVVTC
ncbi:hypothetical protein LSCM4_07870 [Leishmania orientalis]|uniref:Reverse transcriptase domain-containing protein n=1 Tax=Leishmania orientalis TaxID=2249476 RepID=A0A836H1X8_9TRYP|nr:hypothetical protein LSCM4_07870 [Leishmania orientalis]